MMTLERVEAVEAGATWCVWGWTGSSTHTSASRPGTTSSHSWVRENILCFNFPISLFLPGCLETALFPNASLSPSVFGDNIVNGNKRQAQSVMIFIHTQKYEIEIFSVGKWAAPFHSGGKVVTLKIKKQRRKSVEKIQFLKLCTSRLVRKK